MNPTITIVQRGNVDRFGRVRLYLSYAFQYKTNYISTGFKVKPSEWIKKDQKVSDKISGGASSLRINSQILELLSKAYKAVQTLEELGTYPEFKEFRKLLKGEENKEAEKISRFFSDLAAEVLEGELLAGEISDSTRISYMSAVTNFEKTVGKLPFSKITKLVVLKYKGELVSTTNANLASQYTRNVRIVYNKISKTYGFKNTDPFEGISYDFERISSKKELSVDEFEQLFEYFKSIPQSDEVLSEFEILRRFMLMCLGVRFSDTNLIKRTHLIHLSDESGQLLALSKPARKTKQPGIIPIIPENQHLLLRWKGDSLFTPLTRQQYGKELKKLTAKIIGRELTTHYGRHFAGDFIINTDSLDMEDVKAVLGVSSNEVAKIYARRKIKSTVRKYYDAVANKDTKKT